MKPEELANRLRTVITELQEIKDQAYADAPTVGQITPDQFKAAVVNATTIMATQVNLGGWSISAHTAGRVGGAIALEVCRHLAYHPRTDAKYVTFMNSEEEPQTIETYFKNAMLIRSTLSPIGEITHEPRT